MGMERTELRGSQLAQAERRVYERAYVEGLFDSIASRYDLLNHGLSFGIDSLWRRRMIRYLQRVAPQRILDVATGTADLAIQAASVRPDRIVGVDISSRMLERARRKVVQRGLQTIISFRRGAAEQLPFNAGTFDAVMVAFGVRNFSDLRAGLREMARVLRPGGMAAVLEFSQPRPRLVRGFYRAYSRAVIPMIGGIISGNREAYRYLPTTVSEFPSGEAFADLLREAGFTCITWHEQTFGIATIYLATT